MKGFRCHLAAWIALLVMMVVAPLWGCSKKQPEPAARPVEVGIAIPSYVHAVAWVGADAKTFSGQGLDAHVEVMGGSAATMRALIAKQIDFGLAGGDSVMKANDAGADLVVVAGLVDRYYHRIAVRKTITKPSDLKGKTLGLPFLGGPQDMAAKFALRKAGLEYGKDVRVVGLGKEFNRMVALDKGEIDATTSQTPKDELEKMGFNVLFDLPASDSRFPYLVVATNRSYLASNRADVRSFLHGLCDAIRFYQSPDNKETSLQIVGKYLRNADTEGASELRYVEAGPAMLSFPPVPNPRSFQEVYEFMEQPGKVDTDRLFDLSVLTELREMGVCEQK